MNISTFTSFCLKIAGLICILSFFLDIILFAIPFKVQDPVWQVDYISQIVDRGIIPLLGIILILIATWIDGTLRDAGGRSGLNLKMTAFILACILGVLFFVLMPFLLLNVNQVKTLKFEQIKKDVDQSEQQIQTFLGRLTTLSQNPQLLAQEVQQRTRVIETGQFQGRQLTAEEQAVLRQQRDYLQNLRNLAKTPKEFKKKSMKLKRQRKPSYKIAEDR